MTSLKLLPSVAGASCWTKLWLSSMACRPRRSIRPFAGIGNAFRRSFFEIDAKEWESLRSQIVVLKPGRGEHRKCLPLVFTEHGAIKAATILNSPRALQMSVYVVRAFVKARELVNSHDGLARELSALKKFVATLDSDTRRSQGHRIPPRHLRMHRLNLRIPQYARDHEDGVQLAIQKAIRVNAAD